jgi:membrane protease YdiL (CAAX protease family)
MWEDARVDEKRKQGGGFRFDDERPQKGPKYRFTVQEVTEEELARAAKEEARGDAPTTDNPDADPGRWEWRMVAIVLVLLPMVYWLQQWTRELHGETLSTAPAEVRRSEEIRDPGVSNLTVLSKLAVKFAFVGEEDGYRARQKPLDEQEKEADPAPSSKVSKRVAPAAPPSNEDEEEDEGNGTITLEKIESLAWTRTDRLRVAIVAGELEGPQAALSRLQKLQSEAEPGGDLASEIEWLKLVYQKGPQAVSGEAAAALESRHGWFGRLALSFGKPMSDGQRWDVAAGGEEIVEAVTGTRAVIIALSILGMIGLIVGAIVVLRLRRRGELVNYQRPAPGGSVFLETFGIFLAGFAFLLLLDLLFFGLGIEGSVAALGMREVLLWCLVVTTVWPVFRGMGWARWRDAVGWHKGAGIWREIVAGAAGYFCSQPIVWIGALLGYIVEKAIGTEEPAASFGYGLFDVPAEGSIVLFVLGILSAVVWAPVVEETIFRGSLFRHLSGRMNLVWATLISAALFGFIHPYSPSGLIQVASSGLVFGFMRAWRGSLIASVTAHALHNAMVSVMSVVLVTMLG